jgi:Fe2+ or Zn2+ uptake regulation protein
VPTDPPPLEESPRRHRTRQRERILGWLRATESHPTAAQIHSGLAGDFPGLSLGTVYRNLEVLAGQGQVKVVPSAAGAMRYDGNPEPHHHFICDACGRILDVPFGEPRGLRSRLERESDLRVRRVSIDFFGLCGHCEDSAESSHE